MFHSLVVLGNPIQNINVSLNTLEFCYSKVNERTHIWLHPHTCKCIEETKINTFTKKRIKGPHACKCTEETEIYTFPKKPIKYLCHFTRPCTFGIWIQSLGWRCFKV